MRHLLLRLLLATVAIGLVPAAQAAADFSVDPTSLDFSSNAGVPIPTQTFSVINNDTKSISVNLQANSSFGLQVSPPSLSIGKGGSGTATVSVPNGLPAGNYSGSIVVSNSTGSATVSVTVEISGVSIVVAPSSTSVTVQQGKKTTTNFALSGGPASIVVNVSGSGLSGAGASNAPGSYSLTVDATNLTAGSYSGTVSFSCANGGSPCVPQVASVSVTVTPIAVTISVVPSSIIATVTAGQTTTTPAFTITGGPATVQVSASGQGLSGGSANAPGSFSAAVDATGLGPGNYPGTLTFSCAGCNTQTANVVVNVVPPVQLSSSKSSLSFQAYQGRPAPAGQSLVLSAAGGSASFSVQNVPTWLQVSPPSGTASSAPTQITLTVIPSALTLGSNTATISFASGNSTAPVNVSATLAKLSLSATPAQVSATLGPSQTQNIPLTIATADNGAVAVTSTSTTSRGGPWIKLATTDFTAPGPAPAVTLDSTGLSPGSYSGTITYSCAASSQVDCGQTPVPVNLTVTAAAPPSISPGGLIVSSSFGALPTIGPGTYIEIYGQNLSTTTMGWQQFFVNNVAPTTLQGVGVKINGEPAFVNFVSAGQVNALIPGDVSAGPAQVIVSNAQGSSAPFTVNVAPQQPTLLAPAQFVISKNQYVGALLPPDYATTFALPTGAIAGVPSRPAKPGEVVVLYGLGFGPVTQNVPVGTIAPAQTTSLNSALHVLFNQTEGAVPFAGLAPGFVGLYQINVVVPQVADNDAVPLTFTLGGTPGAQTLYIAVHQ